MNGILCIPSNSTPNYISPHNENTTSKINMHPDVHSSTIYSSQETETTVSMNSEWIKKM